MPSPELERRAVEARADLSGSAVEWTGRSDEPLLRTTSRVLSVDSLPERQAELIDELARWKRELNQDAELHLIERSRAGGQPSVIGRVMSRFGTRPEPYGRDVVTALRATGWIITAIDRIDVTVDGSAQRWVDLRAADVRGQVASEQS